MKRPAVRRITSLFIPLALLAIAAPAQDQKTLRARLEAKQKAEFFAVADWTTDFATAKQRARDGKKLIFAYFTRSYAP